jgi:uncharacterized protein with GYD domain
MKYSGSARDVDFDQPSDPEKEIAAMLKAVGGKLLHLWTTLGQYDLIAVAEVPDAASIRAVVAATPKEVSSETMRVFSGMGANSDPNFEGKLKKVIATLPSS